MPLTKVISLLLVCSVCFAFLPAVQAEEGPGAVSDVWECIYDLLFNTDNVTVEGEASFSLDGEHFKTAGLHYVQEGYSSFYDLKLLTPKADGSKRETGWTIIADQEGNVYVMEKYRPGEYREGSTEPHRTLLRRSVQLDAIVNLSILLSEQMDQLLPPGTVTTEETDGGEKIHVSLQEDQIPGLAVSALNLAAVYLSDRWFYYGLDRSFSDDVALSFDSFATITEALAYGTVHWSLQNADVDFTIDAEHRLTAVEGTIDAASTFLDDTVRVVSVAFRLNMKDFGVSAVQPFSPEDYGVTLAEE